VGDELAKPNITSKNSGDTLLKFLAHATPLAVFLIQSLIQGSFLGTGEGSQRFPRKHANRIRLQPDQNIRQYTNSCEDAPERL